MPIGNVIALDFNYFQSLSIKSLPEFVGLGPEHLLMLVRGRRDESASETVLSARWLRLSFETENIVHYLYLFVQNL